MYHGIAIQSKSIPRKWRAHFHLHGDVVKSDIVILPELQASLHAAVVPLENLPDHLKNWHPAPDNIVLDLTHPSLFLLVYGHRISGIQRCCSSPSSGCVPGQGTLWPYFL